MVLVAVNYENDEDRIFLKLAEGATVRIGRNPETLPGESKAELMRIPWGDRLVSRNHCQATRVGNCLRLERLPALPGRAVPNAFHSNEAHASRKALEDPVILEPGDSVAIGAHGETALFWLHSTKELNAAIRRYRADRFAAVAPSTLGFGEIEQLDEYSLRLLLRLLQQELPAQVLAGWTNRRELFERAAAFVENTLPGQKGVTAAFIAVDRNRDGVVQFERLHSDARDRADFQPSRTVLSQLDMENPQPGEAHLWDCQDDSKISRAESLSDKVDWVMVVPLASMETGGRVYRDLKHNRPVYLYVEARQSTDYSAAVFLPFLRLISALIASLLSARDQQRIQDQMATYFSPGLRKMMKERNAENLRPAMADCTVLFADRRGSSHLLEIAKTDDEILARLKENQEIVGKITEMVFATDGVITDFAGDGALCLWGWPSTEENLHVSHALQAVASAEAIVKELASWGIYEAEHKRFMSPVRLGVSTGRIAVGKTGPEQQWHISVFGSVANLGARLERIAKEFKIPVLISDETYQRVKDTAGHSFRKLCLINPAGFSSSYPIYELILPKEWGGSGIGAKDVATYETALGLFVNRQWDEAIDLLDTMPRDDPPATWLRDRAEIFRIRPPEENWRGEIISLSK